MNEKNEDIGCGAARPVQMNRKEAVAQAAAAMGAAATPGADANSDEVVGTAPDSGTNRRGEP